MAGDYCLFKFLLLKDVLTNVVWKRQNILQLKHFLKINSPVQAKEASMDYAWNSSICESVNHNTWLMRHLAFVVVIIIIIKLKFSIKPNIMITLKLSQPFAYSVAAFSAGIMHRSMLDPSEPTTDTAIYSFVVPNLHLHSIIFILR